ncbi:MAG: hypothetical protein ABI810_16325 [Sphingomonas bacterium]
MPKPYEDYLRQFDAALQKIGAVDRQDILREIESHLSLADRRGMAALDAFIAELGSPQKLAESYRLALGFKQPPTPSFPSRLVGITARHARTGATAAGAIVATTLLLTLAGLFALIALLQPLAPQSLPGFIGKFMLGGIARTAEATATLGWSLTAIGGALACGCLLAASTNAKRAWHLLLPAQAI